MKVRVRKDSWNLPNRINDMTKAGQHAFANQVLADSNMYAPFLSGDLRNQSTITMDGKQIIWNVPYARRQYYNYGAVFSTAGTGPKWDKKAQAIHMNEWIKVIEGAMK